MKPLTKRQQEFLGKFLDLYDQRGEPIHYSGLAEHLGVGRITAYEMLRLLEDRGLVQAEYQLPEGNRGPGRSTVVFRPTPLASETLLELAGGDWEEEEWQRAKFRIIEQLSMRQVDGYETLLEELLLRQSDQRSPIIYLTEMVTAIILGLNSIKDTVETRGLSQVLHKIGLPGELGLNALVGLSVGLSIAERVNRNLANMLLAQANKCQVILLKLSSENRRRLADFTREVLDIVDI